MPKKAISSTQVRLDPLLSKKVDELRGKCGFKVSRAAFVDTLILKGINSMEAKEDGDLGESSFKK